jgi:hypothetical protein
MNGRDIFNIAKKINSDIPKNYLPPQEGKISQTQHILSSSFVKDTRGYIEKIVNQINGCYQEGWYDACAVMIRRLLETLIIETYEHYKIEQKIKKPNGDFVYLSDLISFLLSETSWNLGRNTRKALLSIKNIGDYSAHSRRYNAHRQDIDDIKNDFRIVVQELLYLSKLK